MQAFGFNIKRQRAEIHSIFNSLYLPNFSRYASIFRQQRTNATRSGKLPYPFCNNGCQGSVLNTMPIGHIVFREDSKGPQQLWQTTILVCLVRKAWTVSIRYSQVDAVGKLSERSKSRRPLPTLYLRLPS
jgi:hypothetical protein